jgi:hypothetical protein
MKKRTKDIIEGVAFVGGVLACVAAVWISFIWYNGGN